MFGDSFYRCFSGIKRLSHSPPPSISPSSSTTSTTTTTSTTSSGGGGAFVLKNFNSLYNTISDHEAALPMIADSSSSSSCNCPDDADGGSSPSEQDLSKAIASRRLLLASPGMSNSIVDTAVVAVGIGAGVAIPTYSPDPYRDFRRSMEEMVVALDLDRGHLHELLLCYLDLNRKHAHKYIVGAFADLLLGLAGATEEPRCNPETSSVSSYCFTPPA